MELAIFADCSTLIDNFVKKDDFSFTAFCNEWKTLNFQHIYSAQSSVSEVLQTTASIFHIAKRNICGRTTTGGLLPTPNVYDVDQRRQVLRRVACLYLMYAVYFKQPTKEYMKVEVNPQTWRELRTFIDQLDETKEHACYIFWQLMKAHAFRFTANDYYVALDKLVDYDALERNHVKEVRTALVRELPAIEVLQAQAPALVELEKGYNAMKERLMKTDTALNTKALPPTQIFEKIHAVCYKLQKVMDDNGTNEQQITSSSNRRALKRKGFAIAISAEQKNDATADESDDSGEATTSRKSKFRRMSSNTIFTERLPIELLRDLHANSDSAGDEEEECTFSEAENEVEKT